jgi:hypothetical protein
VLSPRATHCASNKKKILFPSSFWGIFDFFSFSIILESLKKNKRMLHYKGGTSVTDILVPSARNTLILREKGTYAGNRHSGKILHGSRCQDAEEK